MEATAMVSVSVAAVGSGSSAKVLCGHSHGVRKDCAPSSRRCCFHLRIPNKLEHPAIFLSVPPPVETFRAATCVGSRCGCVSPCLAVVAKKGAGSCTQRKSLPRSTQRALPIRLIHVSKGQSSGAKHLTQEYAEKVARYCQFEEVQIRPNPKNVSDVNLQVEHEAERVLRTLKPRDWGWSGLAFCIGGPYGHGVEVIARANDKIQLSSLILNHEIARVVLMEQLYRAWTILRGENYHH